VVPGDTAGSAFDATGRSKRVRLVPALMSFRSLSPPLILLLALNGCPIHGSLLPKRLLDGHRDDAPKSSLRERSVVQV